MPKKMPKKGCLPQAKAIDKFYESNDDLESIQSIFRRIFFEFLRTNPSLTTSEIDNIWAIADLLADLSREKQQLAK